MTINDIEDLENRLHGIELPTSPVELYPGTTIIDMQLFISTQLRILKANPNGKNVPAYTHLKDFIELVEQGQ